LPNEFVYHDFHVHVGERIGGYRLRDSFADLNKLRMSDCRKQAVLGSIGVFVTEEENSCLKDKFINMQETAKREFEGDVFWHLSPVHSKVEDTIPLLGAKTDLKLYSTYRNAGLYSSYQQIELWMQALENSRTRILIHCEDDDTIQEYSKRYPFTHPHDHCLRRPELAEIRAVEKVLDLAVKHRHPVHIVHVSSSRAALLIKEAKLNFAEITCETAPHYLLYNESKFMEKNAHRWICTPPFRSEASRGMLVELVQDQVFDIFASDHCAFTVADKDRYQDILEKVPCGIAGIEYLFSSMHKALVDTGKIGCDMLDQLTRINPAKLMNLTY